MARRIRKWVQEHRIVSFLVVTYAWTWTLQGVLAASGMGASWTLSVLVGLGAFGPPVGAAVVVWATNDDLRAWARQVVRWRIGVGWWLRALGLPLAILAIGSVLYVALGGPVDLSALPSPAIYLFAMA